MPESRPPTWWQQGWARQRAGSVAEAELLAPLGELLMPCTPVRELFRSFKSPPGWGGNYLEPDLTTYGVLKDKTAALFLEYDGYYRHGRKEGLARDRMKNAALLAFAPPGSYVIRINHRNKCQLEENVLWVAVNSWRQGDHKPLTAALIDVIEKVAFGLKDALDLRAAEDLRRQMKRESVLISRSAKKVRDATILVRGGNTAEEVHEFLRAEGFARKDKDVSLLQTLALSRGVSINGNLKPKLQWLLSLGLAKSQVAKALASHPNMLRCSLEQNLKCKAQWLLDMGLTKDQVAKAVGTHPAILSLSIDQNLKPTVQWFLDLGLTRSQVAKAVATSPQILCYSIEQNLNPTMQWLSDFGLTKSQVAKAVATHPQILGLSIEKNLKPTAQWFLDLGMTESQVASAVAKFPPMLWYNVEQNLKPTIQWLLDLGLKQDQVSKALFSHPQILGLSIEQNLEPKVQWLVGLGLRKSQVADAVVDFPQILGLSTDKNLALKFELLLSFYAPTGAVELIAMWPRVFFNSHERLQRRLHVLAEQNSLEKLRNAMRLDEETFNRRFLADKICCMCGYIIGCLLCFPKKLGVISIGSCKPLQVTKAGQGHSSGG